MNRTALNPVFEDGMTLASRIINTYITGLVAVVGIFANCLTIVTMRGKAFNKLSLSVHFIALAVSDSGMLMTTAFNQIYKGMYRFIKVWLLIEENFSKTLLFSFFKVSVSSYSISWADCLHKNGFYQTVFLELHSNEI